ncbi:MAG: methylenetetrahydrofolate--tRNA-(uracil(54)-C(5))-methyltransferase (FADH(2)-oxidizing) TrmFO [Clostridia bacterium]|nr:methylenetetrahydrofolate--tRNA-(uracil(54)-C(5))-methyltransferase (FADH(2)-oxidizing) TrmFO [Clostridia bacterium]
MQNKPTINVIGAGLAGCEAALAAAKAGVYVNLFEMKPQKFTPAHHSENFAELVCSNSLRSDELSNAVGVLKEEMRKLGSIVLESAEKCRVSAGTALAVDRELFSSYITNAIRQNEYITVFSKEVTSIPDDGITVVATGPLTSDDMTKYLQSKLGFDCLHFFDAAAPIVSADSIDFSKAYFASRYQKGDAAYINCPFDEEEYTAFWQNLCTAKEAELHDFDKEAQKLEVFEGCMPVEVMAKRGKDTLLFGPLKPVGLPYPGTDITPFAVVQLRPENEEKTMYNIVGFQTHLTFSEQKRVFGMIPGLENAEFLRYGVMHRNTFINSPGVLDADYSMVKNGNIFFAGQMTGVEGYIESSASGIVAGMNAARRALSMDKLIFPDTTVIGAMAKYISEGSPVGAKFQPMNANFGIVPELGYRVKGGKRVKNQTLGLRALKALDDFADQNDIKLAFRKEYDLENNS